MKNTYEQLNIEYTETREVSPQIKIVTIFLALIFALIPLAELVYEFDHNNLFLVWMWFRGTLILFEDHFVDENLFYPRHFERILRSEGIF